jgi:hypothetical protein
VIGWGFGLCALVTALVERPVEVTLTEDSRTGPATAGEAAADGSPTTVGAMVGALDGVLVGSTKSRAIGTALVS